MKTVLSAVALGAIALAGCGGTSAPASTSAAPPRGAPTSAAPSPSSSPPAAAKPAASAQVGALACDKPVQAGALIVQNCADAGDVLEVKLLRFTQPPTAGRVDVMASNTADGSSAQASSITFNGSGAQVTFPAKDADGSSNGSLAGVALTVTRNADGSFSLARTR